jgi:hypothetical protein
MACSQGSVGFVRIAERGRRIALLLRDTVEPDFHDSRHGSWRQHTNEGVIAPEVRGASHHVAKDALELQRRMEIGAENRDLDPTKRGSRIGYETVYLGDRDVRHRRRQRLIEEHVRHVNQGLGDGLRHVHSRALKDWRCDMLCLRCMWCERGRAGHENVSDTERIRRLDHASRSDYGRGI